MNFSVVIITNSKRPLSLNSCVLSAKSLFDEVIVVGDVENLEKFSDVKIIEEKELADTGKISRMRNIGADHATGDFVINCDDDVLFPIFFRKNLFAFIQDNPSIEVFTTKVIGSRGGRYWDRSVHKNEESWMLDYDEPYDEDLYYSGAFVVRRKEFAKKYQWDENLRVFEKEDVLYSKMIFGHGYKVNIDQNNYVIHWDDRYITYRSSNGNLVCEKENTEHYKNEIHDEKIFREVKSIIKLYSLKQ